MAPAGVVGEMHPGTEEDGLPFGSVGLVGHVNQENDWLGIESYVTPVIRAALVKRCCSNVPQKSTGQGEAFADGPVVPEEG